MTELSRAVQREAFQLADEQSDALRDVVSLVPAFNATVTAVQAAAGPGGNALITFRWRGGEYTAAAYAAAYTPNVGHRVLVVLVDHQPQIVCRLID